MKISSNFILYNSVRFKFFTDFSEFSNFEKKFKFALVIQSILGVVQTYYFPIKKKGF